MIGSIDSPRVEVSIIAIQMAGLNGQEGPIWRYSSYSTLFQRDWIWREYERALFDPVDVSRYALEGVGETACG